MKILLPLDGSPLALEAVHHALRLVHEGLRASFVLANVQEPIHLYEVVLARDTQVVEQASEEAALHALQAGRALLDAAGLAYDIALAQGDPAHALVDLAEEHQCDAIVIAPHRHGAVSQSLVQSSPIPVTIVRPPAERPQEEV